MSNFQSIGFNVSSKEELTDLINLVIKDGKHYAIDKNRAYKILKDSSGACLFLQGTRDGIVGMNPCFEGTTSIDVAFIKSLERVKGTLDGAYLVWVNPNEALNSGIFPTAVDIPNFYENQIDIFPTKGRINITGFPDPDVKIFSSVEYFHDNQDGGKFSSKSFISQGMFTAENQENTLTEAIGLLSAEVTSSKTLINSINGLKFQHIQATTSDCEMDFVFPDNERNRSIEKGNVLWGSFWLSGRILSYAKPKSKSLFNKIFK